MLSFALDRALWGAWAPGFHATNGLCHLAVAWLVGALARAVGLAPGVALASALVFAAHPVQAEAVTYVSGRTDPLCALFVLLALLAWRRARAPLDRFALAAAAAVVLALLAKEAAALVPLVLLVPGAHPDVRPPRPWLPLAVGALWLAAWSTGGGAGVHLGGLAERLPAIAGSALAYARLLVLPLGLHLERFTPVPGWSPLAAAGAWALVLALAAALVAAARRVPGGFFLLALGALAYAPVSNFVPVYPAIAGRTLFTAEHFLYLPLVGLVPLAVGAVAALWPVSAARARPVVLATALALWGTIVVQRNRDWRDEETLFHTPTEPSPRASGSTSAISAAAGRLAEAERLMARRVSALRDATAQLNQNRAQRRSAAEAEAQYRAAIASDPRPRAVPRARGAARRTRGHWRGGVASRRGAAR
jgi:hypothetical protein